MFCAEKALLQDKKQLLISVNNKAKTRRSTPAHVVGTAKVMSYEDIVEAREKRAAKDIQKAKGKRGRKRKRAMPDTDESGQEPEPEPEMERAPEEVTKARKDEAGNVKVLHWRSTSHSQSQKWRT